MIGFLITLILLFAVVLGIAKYGCHEATKHKLQEKIDNFFEKYIYN